jgi:predicted outer membrane lipoprotein
MIVALPFLLIGTAFTTIGAILGICLTIVISPFGVIIGLIVEHQEDKELASWAN